MTRATLETYYAAFNAGDAAGMLACLTDDVEHRVNEGGIRRAAAGDGAGVSRAP